MSEEWKREREKNKVMKARINKGGIIEKRKGGKWSRVRAIN